MVIELSRRDALRRAAMFIAATLMVASAGRAESVESKIVVSTPTPRVYVGDQILIDVEATAIEDEIDFTSLWKQLELQRQTHGTRVAVVEGKVVEVRIWRFEATAAEPTDITLGPLRVGEVVSNAIRTQVLAAPDVRWVPNDDDIRLHVEWSKKSLYVQEQLLLTVRVEHRYPVAHLDIDTPELTGFRIIPLIKERRTEREGALGREYSFVNRYALFAQTSGALTVPAFVATGQIIKSRLERAEFELSTERETIQILPAPRQSDGRWWLPALNLTASDVWSKDKRWLAAGEQVQRSAIIEASGVSAEQLPEIVLPQVNGLRISYVKSERETKVHDNGVSARARFDFNVRALSPIPVFPDPIPIYWWNTRDDRPETAYIRTGRIDIGAPSREALLESAAQERRLLDTLSPYKGILWLLSIGFAVTAMCGHWFINRAALKQQLTSWRRRTRHAIADYKLRTAARRGNEALLAAFHDWQRTTGFKVKSGDVALLDAYLDGVYSPRVLADSRANGIKIGADLVRALIKARRIHNRPSSDHGFAIESATPRLARQQ